MAEWGPDVRDTLVGDGWRWYIAVVALVGAAAMLASFVYEWRRRDRTRNWIDGFAEAAALLGGYGTCFFISFGTLGVIYGWDSVLRLPGLAAALTFTAVGRGIQFWRRWKRSG